MSIRTISWSEAASKAPVQAFRKTMPNFQVQTGKEHRIRIISDLQEIVSHRYTGQKTQYDCSGEESCTYCKDDVPKIIRQCVLVIDRNDMDTIKAWEVNATVAAFIKEIEAEPGNENLSSYDIKILREGVRWNTTYSLVPQPLDKRKQLTLDELEEISKAEKAHDWLKHFNIKPQPITSPVYQNVPPEAASVITIPDEEDWGGD
jgi:hypothetical protein